jgi:16S rRNA (cytidine1402-2'-O)-methyltransferase
MPLTPPHDTDPQEYPGSLYVVATPIGNRDDITLRALKILASVDLVAAEDTRNTGKLLAMHDIRARLISYQEHNESRRTPELLKRLSRGRSIALVSDAGTPSVSDPGFRLIQAAIEGGIPVIPVPGVSAAIAAVSVSGLPTDSFIFIGFPAKKKGARARQLAALAASPRTLVFYESPRRIVPFIQEVSEVFGDRRAVLGREMTKVHEEFLRGPLSSIRSELACRPRVKGECTLLVAGADPAKPAVSTADLAAEIRRELAEGTLRPSDLARALAARHGLSRGKIYERILEIRNEPE